MTTKTDACNLALSNLAQDVFLADVDTDKSKAAYICNRWFDVCVDEVLEDFPWRFSETAVALSLSVDAPLPGWTYAYALPSDCVVPLEVMTSAGNRRATSFGYDSDFGYRNEFTPPRYPWRIALSADGESKLLLTDLQSAYLAYTRRLTNPSVWPASFLTAFSWRLAAAIERLSACR